MYKNNTEKIEEAKKAVRQIIDDLKIHANLSSNNQDISLLTIIRFLVGGIEKATTLRQVKMLQLIASAARNSIILGKSLKESLAIEQAKIMDTANSPEEVKENLIVALGSLALILEEEGYKETAAFLRKMQKVIEKEVDLSNESADGLRDIKNCTISFFFDMRVAQAKSTTDQNLIVVVKNLVGGLFKRLGLSKEAVLEEDGKEESEQDEQVKQKFSNLFEKSQDKMKTPSKSQTQENKSNGTETSRKVEGDNTSPSTSCQPKKASPFKILCNILHHYRR